MSGELLIPRILCLLIGYAFGCILTGDLIARKAAGKSAFEIGSGNPGMANVMAQCGFKAGICVLIGDLLKTFAACLICRFILYPVIEKSMPGALAPAALYSAWAGLGAVLGHNFPFWHRFDGGKGVSCTCAVLFMIHPLWGTLAMIVGMLIVFATKYLPIGAVFIPAVFIPYMLYACGREGTLIMAALTLIMFIRHLPAMRNIPSGKEKKIDVPALIAKKLGKK
ncbi:MAG: glycerol-3-phosphate acyltransferase [Lachnospiraceae bacterium]|nr:glycerol-3-phosphate acyltransferase [Lachnospiraceae bacterium]